MIKTILMKLKESLISVLPVALIVIILYFTPLVDLTGRELMVFLVTTVMFIVGVALFNLGADLAMTPMGNHVGSGMTKTNNILVLLSVAFLMGLLITVAEPDLSVLSSQVKDKINPTLLMLTVGVGVGLFLLLAIVKIITKKSLSYMLMFFYLVIFSLTSILVVGGNGDFIPLSFDSGGVTTGPITVPFIMALGVGIATTLGGKNAGENSFGLIALCSIGPIIAVLILGTFSKGEVVYEVPSYAVSDNLIYSIGISLLQSVKEVALALFMIVLFFIVLQIFFLKLPKKKLIQIGVGVLFTFVGLVLFLSAVSVGFMPIGFKMGKELAENTGKYITLIGFILGIVVVLAEPAVKILNKQVEEVTSRTVGKRSMMIALSVGVGISLLLSLIRIIFNFSILYYLVPGYLLSLGLSFFVPPIYTAIAFDSGGVVSGPLTSSFILPFSIGACIVFQGSSAILTTAFGVVAMVAMTPLITIQLLGFRAITQKNLQRKIAMRRILQEGDEQIISFL